jgi:hypothetical protein
MIRIRRDELRCGNRRRRVFRRLDSTMDIIPEYGVVSSHHKTGRDGPDLFEDLMSKQRRAQPQDSIFANNPFVDGFLEWMGSREGQQCIEIHDVLWDLLEDVQLDAKQRQLIWPDAERLDLWATIRKTIPRRNSTSLTASQSDGSPTISERQRPQKNERELVTLEYEENQDIKEAGNVFERVSPPRTPEMRGSRGACVCTIGVSIIGPCH